MKKTVSILLTLVTVCLLLVSCGGGKKNDLVGTWEPRDYDFGEEYVLTFSADGTGTYFGETIRYEINGNKLSIWWEGTESLDTTFKVNGDEMSFKDSNGEDVFWTKKK